MHQDMCGISMIYSTHTRLSCNAWSGQTHYCYQLYCQFSLRCTPREKDGASGTHMLCITVWKYTKDRICAAHYQSQGMRVIRFYWSCIYYYCIVNKPSFVDDINIWLITSSTQHLYTGSLLTDTTQLLKQSENIKFDAHYHFDGTTHES